MANNPFDKQSFSCYRDWEESFLDFFVREASSPMVEDWLLFVNDESRERVAFCALLLSNLLEYKSNYCEAAKKVGEVSLLLANKHFDVNQYGEWLRSGWLDVSRVAHSLDVRLRNLVE